MSARVRRDGEFCWINILSPQPDEGRAFFGRLLGWTFAEMPGIGHRIQVGGRDVGGFFDTAGPNTPPDTKPIVGVMVKVASADHTVRHAAALGGRARAPFDIGPQGRMSVCHDPTGAEFDVWQPQRMAGTDVDARTPGAPTWFELLTTDAGAARAFYGSLFGWEAEETPLASSVPAAVPGATYTTFRLDRDPVAGMLAIGSHMAPMASHWATYFAVERCQTSETAARTLGGRVFIPSQTIPGVGTFCGIASPQGVPFYILERDR
jgi:predicted enzyme related to lactoylglutathione lyase